MKTINYSAWQDSFLEQRIRMVGYPKSEEYKINTSGTEKFQWKSNGEYYEVRENCALTKNCDSFPGMSGSPVILYD